ncbi:amino acid dehydrogenase (plasmid) [Paracoccus denitrificans]|uniref:Glu/Leu/Phe/Val family dehydrogenase n=1 Tax=Paracoccus denitrificans TaxID=266 RepID=UPI001E4F35C8|nr:Glu/Leu/Phe/Val dehydrogenase dimerization domain-containing protein [Paracoccus denitrificans]UFS68436.1 amino acid dehydrogenase [Paracoccus denitrificans]
MALVITDETPPAGYERLVHVEDVESGLDAFICIHSTACGPAAGGCRMWNYASLDDARRDVLRLAEGMTCKNAIADLGLGGGKSVIIGNSRTDKSEALFRAFGRAVDSLGGLYYTAEDVGITPDDMAIVASETPYAVGLNSGTHASGDPSPFTAEGVFQCLRVGTEQVFGSADLTGKRVLVQGLGHVGMALAEKLHAAGAVLIVSDLNQNAVKRAQTDLGAEICSPEEVFSQQMDIFAPCALGGILTAETVARLTAKVVCGAANNQLATPDIAEHLRARGISYLPDYVVNGGGIISVAGEIHRRGENYRRERLAGIAERIRRILALSQSSGKTTTEVASDMVADILAQASSRRVLA